MQLAQYQRVQWPIPKSLENAICDALKATGEPEAVPELFHGPIDKAEPFRKIVDLSIPRDRRADGRRAPCPMCHQPNKFFEGQLVWLIRLEAVALIGHCCASKNTQREADIDFRARKANERAQDYLLEMLPKLPLIRADLSKLAPRVEATQAVLDKFRNSGAMFQAALRRATKSDGTLSVAELIQLGRQGGPSGLRGSGTTINTRDVRFGMLAGRSAIMGRCILQTELSEAISWLARFPNFVDDDTIIEFLSDLEDIDMRVYEKILRQSQTILFKIRSEIDEIANFFTEKNAECITSWGTHRDAPIYMKANCRASQVAGHIEFEIIGSNGRRSGFLIPPTFWPDGHLPRVGNLSNYG